MEELRHPDLAELLAAKKARRNASATVVEKYTIPQNTTGVSLAVTVKENEIVMEVDGKPIILTPEGARDLGNTLLVTSSILLRKAIPTGRRRHKK